MGVSGGGIRIRTSAPTSISGCVMRYCGVDSILRSRRKHLNQRLSGWPFFIVDDNHGRSTIGRHPELIDRRQTPAEQERALNCTNSDADPVQSANGRAALMPRASLILEEAALRRQLAS